MRPPGLPPDRMALLRAAVHRHSPTLERRLATLGTVPLNLEEREALRSAVLDEFLETGLDDSQEPNKRGLNLQSIIDDLGHL